MKVTRYRRLGLDIKTNGIGWALVETRPPPEALPRLATDGDPIAAILDRAARAKAAGAESIYLYRYTEETFGRAGVKRNGMTFHEHSALLVRAWVALRESGYKVEFHDA